MTIFNAAHYLQRSAYLLYNTFSKLLPQPINFCLISRHSRMDFKHCPKLLNKTLIDGSRNANLFSVELLFIILHWGTSIRQKTWLDYSPRCRSFELDLSYVDLLAHGSKVGLILQVPWFHNIKLRVEYLRSFEPLPTFQIGSEQAKKVSLQISKVEADLEKIRAENQLLRERLKSGKKPVAVWRSSASNARLINWCWFYPVMVVW